MTLIPIDERKATREAAQRAIDATLSARTAEAEKLLGDAQRTAARGTAALTSEAERADIEARERAAKAFTLQFTPLVSELLKHEQLDIAREATSKYCALQAESLKYCGRYLPLMPLAAVGQVVITRAPEAKSCIARLETVGGFNALHADKQISAAHAALMGGAHDPRGARDAIYALERRLVEIGNIAIPGDHTDEVWEAVKRGCTFYEIDDMLRGFAKAAQQDAAAAAAERQEYVRAVRRGDADALAKANQTPGLGDAFRRLGAEIFGAVGAP